MPEVVELREVTDRRDVIHRAAQRLSAGELVALPSETGAVLVASCLVERNGKKIPATSGVSQLLLRNADEVLDYLPGLSQPVFRIARRCWPGLLVLKSRAIPTEGFLAALPEACRAELSQTGELSVRVSSHPVLSEVAKVTRGPLRIVELPELSVVRFDIEDWRDISLVVTEQNPGNAVTTVVRVDDHGWQIERVGGVTENRLQVAACEIILFVCTGNTCRSPMAEGMFRKMLADRLQCAPQDLLKRGYVVASAGVAADYGSPASYESTEVMRQQGIDLRGHTSQPLSDRLLEHADRCYTLTAGHRRTILANRPEAESRVQLLSRDGKDVPDPIGGGMNDYLECAAVIEENLKLILKEVVPG